MKIIARKDLAEFTATVSVEEARTMLRLGYALTPTAGDRYELEEFGKLLERQKDSVKTSAGWLARHGAAHIPGSVGWRFDRNRSAWVLRHGRFGQIAYLFKTRPA